ncbi:GtrA family protein [Lacticaseibacillus jixianensis]|uniref:GtrA family protein n=1 Tax=Lacticaseibacillus jixianensis TaxID=2486012 RepID=A0ABW4B911_9LACO|nr:GtrA family protein [Lacticaseibacillus jixianensis]
MRFYRQFRAYLVRRKVWEVTAYLFFGILTTLVNVLIFSVAFRLLELPWPTSNSLSWLVSVIFAFFTNKLWVFHSGASGTRSTLWTLLKFMLVRILSYGLDMLTMWLIIDAMHGNELIAKLITQVLVVAVNYIFSKLFVFADSNSG